MTRAIAEELKEEDKERRKEVEREGYDKDMSDKEKQKRGDKGMHIFCQHRMAYIVDVHIMDWGAARNRRAPSYKILEMNKKEKEKEKEKHYY